MSCPRDAILAMQEEAPLCYFIYLCAAPAQLLYGRNKAIIIASLARLRRQDAIISNCRYKLSTCVRASHRKRASGTFYHAMPSTDDSTHCPRSIQIFTFIFDYFQLRSMPFQTAPLFRARFYSGTLYSQEDVDFVDFQ